MKNHNNTWTIIRKEFARFFGDRQLVFTAVIMPGLLIYLIYSLMGVGIRNMETQGEQDVVTLRVENMPPSLEALFNLGDSSIVLLQQPVTQPDIDALSDKDINAVLMRFPAGFEELVATYQPQSGAPAPNIEIYYNSANNASSRVYYAIEGALTAYENSQTNLFDINRADSEEQRFDQATDDQVVGDILSKLIPMLIIMMLFSGTMAIAPSAIAGEKERGTIATLLVTPMKRSELALGKIVSLSSIALLSGHQRLHCPAASHPCIGSHHGLCRQPALRSCQGREERRHHDYPLHARHHAGRSAAHVPDQHARQPRRLSHSLLQLH